MKATALLVLASFAAPAVWPSAFSAEVHSVVPDGKAVKMLEAWIKAYRGGKIAMNGKQNLMGSSIAVKGGLISKDEYRKKTHEDELRLLCEKSADANDDKAAKALLQVAAIGLDRKGKYESEMTPATVRVIGEESLDRLTGSEALDYIATVAAKSVKRPKDIALQAAAVRCLGRLKNAKYVETIAKAMTAEDPLVRLHAADAMYAGQYKGALPLLTERLPIEEDPTTKMRLIDAMYRVYEGNKASVGEAELKAAADAAGKAVGSANWRIDLAAVTFLKSVRSKQSVAPLIDILVRFAAADTSVPQTDDLSGVVRHRAFDALREVTGATFPMEDANKWADWWVKAEADFKPTEKTVDFRGDTVTADFFGVPVEGSRVLFIVDTSGSMEFPKTGKVGGKLTGKERKIDVAKRELLAAVQKLPDGSQFNIVQFGMQAKPWQKKLVPNDKATLKKYEKYIDKLSAGGGTNIWDGLKLGLDIHSFVHGDRFGVDVDEVFVLSDGLPSPTIGEVWKPNQIIRLIAEANTFAKVKINTIYIAGDPEDEKKHADEIGMSGAELMKTIADQNGGAFVEF